jgi:hypothetical protein
MAFDIQQDIFDKNGELIEDAVEEYQDQLVELFQKSPEGQGLINEGLYIKWLYTMMDYSINYLGVTPARMSASDFREILFDIFPAKVTTTPEAAPEIIPELRAFWKFLQREFHLTNATECLKVLDDKAEQKLRKELANPANYGMAKSMMMMGLERGFDLTTQEGVNEWMLTYNAEIAPQIASELPPPAAPRIGGSRFTDQLNLAPPKVNKKRKRKKR